MKRQPTGTAVIKVLEQDMPYIVVYQRADGSSGVEECNDLDLAIVTAERLRNVDAVERPRIFETKEIKFDFRPYYRIEVTDGDTDADATSSAPAAESTTADDEDGATESAEPTDTTEPPAPSIISGSGSGLFNDVRDKSDSGADSDDDGDDDVAPRRGLFGR